MKILLKTFRDVSNFCASAQKCEGTVKVESGSFVVNAKSLLGLYSIDLTSPINVVFDESEKEFTEFLTNYKVD